jgi:hypothetical protein
VGGIEEVKEKADRMAAEMAQRKVRRPLLPLLRTTWPAPACRCRCCCQH